MKAVMRALIVAVVLEGCSISCFATDTEADDVIAALDAEIAEVGEGVGSDAKTSSKDGTVPAANDRQQPEHKTKPTSLNGKKKPKAKLIDENHAIARGYGKGKTEAGAKLAAFRSAIENAVGVYVDAESLMQNYEMVKDRVRTISNGDIKEYKTMKNEKKDGVFFIVIEATVEKKAIAPKFKDVFPDAFGNVDGSAIVGIIKNVEDRQKAAAELMKAALQDVNRLQGWTRLSVGKGTVKDSDSSKQPGKRSYSVVYTMEIDQEAYLKGFVPHFKQTLEKIQEGKSQEVVLKVEPMEAENGPTLSRQPATRIVDPVVLSGFPGVAITSGPINRGTGGNPTCFMYDEYKGVKQVQPDRTFNYNFPNGLGLYKAA